MKIAIGSDHAGFDLKEYLLREELGPRTDLDVTDMGTDSEQSVDYPDFAKKVAKKVTDGEVDFGILICGTGIGMSMTANKFAGIRAVNATNSYTAKMARRHNNSNILCLGSRNLGTELAAQILSDWLKEDFDGGRHQRRVDKISS